MGSKLSPSLANIFCHIFELKMIDNEIKNGNIKNYFRYVDDIICVIKKNKTDQIFEKINTFHAGLKFTMNKMVDSKIVFLDTTVINTDGKLSLEMFRKPESSDCLINFRTGVSPKNQKISTLTGELYRCHHTTSTPQALDLALNSTKKIFLKNQYPEKLINQKIRDVKIKNFPPSESKARREETLKNPDLVHHTLSIPYSSFRCSVLSTKIKKILQQFTPNFCLNISFSTIKLSSVILPRLKPEKSYYFNSNLTYEYNCPDPCNESYTGETQRLLHERILEHGRKGPIYEHVEYCEHYDQKCREKFGCNPDYLPGPCRRKYFESHFKIVEKNLYYKAFRETFEGVIISLKKPSLNTQVPHNCLTFICTHEIPNTAVT